jgi:lambda repressor-like predicted transcriptional regulator
MPGELSEERYWHRIIASMEASGLNLPEFCRKHRINVSELRNAIRRQQYRDERALGGQQKIVQEQSSIEPKVALGGRTNYKPTAGNPTPPSSFAEVRLCGAAEDSQDNLLDEASSLEIIFSSGTRLRLGACLPDTILSVITLLENR